MATDIVFSLQRAGADAVFSLQFPATVASSLADGSGLSTRRRRRPTPERFEPAEPIPETVAMAVPILLPAPLPEDDDEDEFLLAATVLLLMH